MGPRAAPEEPNGLMPTEPYDALAEDQGMVDVATDPVVPAGYDGPAGPPPAGPPPAGPPPAGPPPSAGPLPPGYDPLAPPGGSADEYDPIAMIDPGADAAPEMLDGALDDALDGDPMLGQPMADGDDALDDAPTRIEREEDIKASMGGDAGLQHEVPRVVIIGGNNRGKEYPLKMADNSLGRGVDNDVILADIAVSRKHTLICFEGSGFVVRDLGSGNGTLLNGKRVDTHPLQDGDQLELGNTLLRFLTPAPVEAQPGFAGAIAKIETVVTPRGLSGEDARMTADVPAMPVVVHTAAVDQPTRRETRGEGMSRTMKLVVFGSAALVLLFGLMIGAKLLMSRSSQQQAQPPAAAKEPSRPPDEIAAQEFQEGTTQYRARNWEKARMHFLKVLKLAPSFDQAKHYADQAATEISAGNALSRAKNSLAAKDYKAVRTELAKIPSTSAYAAEARTLKQKVDDEQVTKLLAEARALKEGDDTEAALARVKEARAISPTNAEVLALHGELAGSSGKRHVAVRARTHAAAPPSTPRAPSRPRPAPRSQPRTTPSRAEPRPQPGKTISVRGGRAKAALNLYRQKQWGQAYKEAKSHAQGLSGRQKRSAEALAEAIRMVGQSWNRAEHMTKTSAKLKYYQLALRHDAKIPRTPHQRTLRGKIGGMATTEATNALSKGNYPAAAKAVKQAEANGGGSPRLDKVKKQLEQKAMQLFTRAYTMRGSNITQARKLWQQVLRMVPPSSKAYQKAYQWLNNSTPTYQDEDED